ncbi:hypothetical protein [Streptomyces sp. NPDC023588]|uniref:hypothetical protein n=1 Tax=Streptomyces sp. NPDC023588 TaxID=3154907 RepID=UPI0033D4521A
MAKDETWKSEERGRSHEGRVAVLLFDGTRPEPVYFDSASGPSGMVVRVTAPTSPPGPAPVLRAECA